MAIFILSKEFNNTYLAKLPEDAYLLLGAKPIAIENVAQIIPTDEAIMLYHPLIVAENTRLSFGELLLDERYSGGYLGFPISIMRQSGYLNERVPAKRIYEWLLRMAEHYPVIGHIPLPFMAFDEFTQTNDSEAEFQAESYIVSKYASYLKEWNYFDEIVQALILQAQESENAVGQMAYLEQMIGKAEHFWKIADGLAPILIYYGVTYCYNIMNVLAEQLGKALRMRGEQIEAYDEQQDGVEGLAQYVDRRFKAVIGIQTYLMSAYMKKAGCYLHDQIKGPKFNMVLDHPIWLKGLLEKVPSEYYVLTHDQNYQEFITRYYQTVAGTYLFPPAGIQSECKAPYQTDKAYQVVFIGTYGDYRSKLEAIRKCVPSVRRVAARFLFYLKKEPNLMAEESFKKVMQDYHIQSDDETFLNMFYEMRSVVQAIMYYYREKTVKVLLDAGIVIDVWGNSWEHSPLAGHSELCIHDEVTTEESLAIMQQAKISLNVMAWHKGGFTERMANSMLAGAVVLTDETTYQEHGLKSGQQLEMFSLERLNELPQQVRILLADDKKRIAVAKSGYEYAMKYHTWDKRAEQFLQIIDQIDREGVSK